MQNTDFNSDAPQQGAEYRSLAPKRRALFQIHLSTAIVLMFVAGFLIWASVAQRKVQEYGIGTDRIVKYRYGWPLDCAANAIWFTDSNDIRGEVWERLNFRYLSLFINVIVALAIQFIVWYACEWLIRWRSARKGA